jgi:hypothetical protein
MIPALILAAQVQAQVFQLPAVPLEASHFLSHCLVSLMGLLT